MPISLLIAVVEGVLTGAPKVITAYQDLKAASDAGGDVTPAQLKLTEAAVEVMYDKLRLAATNRQ